MITFSQAYLFISSSCNLRCLGCDLSSAPSDRSAATILALLESGEFFNYYPKKKLYHIMGGDPVLSPELPRILEKLSEFGIKTALWTHAHHDRRTWADIAPKATYLCLYLCATDAQSYKEFTGYNGWNEFVSVSRSLSISHPNLIIHFPILPGRLEFVPDVHTLTQTLHCKLVLHYTPALFSKNQKAHISRYRDIKNVSVFRSEYLLGICNALPFLGITQPWQILENLFQELRKNILAFTNFKSMF